MCSGAQNRCESNPLYKFQQKCDTKTKIHIYIQIYMICLYIYIYIYMYLFIYLKMCIALAQSRLSCSLHAGLHAGSHAGFHAGFHARLSCRLPGTSAASCQSIASETWGLSIFISFLIWISSIMLIIIPYDVQFLKNKINYNKL